MTKPATKKSPRAAGQMTVRQMAKAVKAGTHSEKALAAASAKKVRANLAPTVGVKAAGSTREVYQSEIAGGMTPAEVAKKYGVSRQAVHMATTGYAARITSQRELDRVRKPPTGKREPYTCSVCGGAHNAQRHNNADAVIDD